MSSTENGLSTLSLRNAPSLIERVWPVQKISAEAQKERKAVQGQTLVGLASYWKGRKPLILARACILGALLPATGDDETDLHVFELLMGMHDDQIVDRLRGPLSAADIEAYGSAEQLSALLPEPCAKGDKRIKNRSASALEYELAILRQMPYTQRVARLYRPESIPTTNLAEKHLAFANNHLGTHAKTLSGLIEELGVARFGRRPLVADTFSGGGSIPFEAARLGCDVYAADLNPVACMLTWGAVDFLGSGAAFMQCFESERRRVIDALDRKIELAGIEHNQNGERSKIYFYCVEALHGPSGWRIPLSSSWILHEGTRTILKLNPDAQKKRFDFTLVVNANDEDYAKAAEGTVKGGDVVFFDGTRDVRLSIATLRGDRIRRGEQASQNDLRTWAKSDVSPREGDIFGERLCAIRWSKGANDEYFTVPGPFEDAIETRIIAMVKNNLAEWQAEGLIPDMQIEPGNETSRLLRERGWSYWHHLFNARQLLLFKMLLEECRTIKDEKIRAGMLLIFGKALNRGSRLCQWQPHRAISGHVFYNQALNTFFQYGCRAFSYFDNIFEEKFTGQFDKIGNSKVENCPADQVSVDADIFITDPPYADAVNYHEITEFFIAWMRSKPPAPFEKWIWDSRRPLAIKGNDGDFRRGMVNAYTAMSDHMPINGVQIVMFTHQNAGVWGDMAQIFWASGLQVMAAWYIATETTSEIKKGGYVQGTVILVLRKRLALESGYKDEIVQEIKAEVASQIETMTGLNQSLKGHGRAENLFEDADLQMAGYAAALRVLTRYTKIDGIDVTKEAIRTRDKSKENFVGEIIDFAVQVANEHMVPEEMPPHVWGRLSRSERFFFKMMEVEKAGTRKLDNYQNFAKAFRAPDYTTLMSSLDPNGASLKSAREFKQAGFEGEFGSSMTRAVLFALTEIINEVDGEEVLSHLRDLIPQYFIARPSLIEIADFIAKTRTIINDEESRAARVLYSLLRNERLS